VSFYSLFTYLFTYLERQHQCADYNNYVTKSTQLCLLEEDVELMSVFVLVLLQTANS